MSKTGTWTITLNPGETFDGGPIIHPPHDSDVDLPDLTLRVTETDSTTGQSGSTTMTVGVIVDAVADTPDVDAPDNRGPEGTPLDVSITAHPGDTDGSETIVKYQISGLPDGFSFNHGHVVAPGVWEFTPEEINSLQALPPDDEYHGTICLDVTVFTTETPVTDQDFDDTNNDASASDPFTLTWLPAADPPCVCVNLPKDPNSGVKTAEVYEDNSVTVRVTSTLAHGHSAEEVMTVKVTGIDLTKLDALNLEGEAGAVWTRVPGSPDTAAEFTITLPAGTNYSGDFTFTPKAQSDLDLTNMHVTATTYEPATQTTAQGNEEVFSVIVDAVADKPSIEVHDVQGQEGQPIALDIAGHLGVDNFDGSESITGYQIKGQLAGYTFTDAQGNPVGTHVSNSLWTFTPAEITGLHIVAPSAEYVGSLNLTAVVLTVDTPNDVDFDTTNNTNSAEDGFTLTWLPVADPPTVCVDLSNDPDSGVKTAQVYEDSSVNVRVTGSLAGGHSSDEVLTMKVSGIDLTKLDHINLEGAFGAVWTRVLGSLDTAAEFTITLPAGTNYSGLFTFTPKAQSDLDLTNMHVTASAYEPATQTTAQGNEEVFSVIVDAVADKPSIEAHNVEGHVGQALALDIAGRLGADNFDGSESITGYQIKGQLAGYTFTDAHGNPVGTHVSDSLWTFTPDEIVGLHIMSSSNSHLGASLNLTAVVLTVDTPHDSDFNHHNNTNSAESFFNVCFSDDQPVAVDDDEGTVTALDVAKTGNVMTNDDRGDDLPTIVTKVGTQDVGTNGLTVQGTYGVLTIYQDGSYSYTAKHYAQGQENFTYTIADSDGDTSS
ncbi:MAG: Ig-like domain-containing protein, partial [Alphaproteobacteria bacterium]|nr:Ig-like domain-containing protein [Alphaproteobacteria bacterium]